MRSGGTSAHLPRRGAEMRDLGVVAHGYVHIEGSRIVDVAAGEPSRAQRAGAEIVDARGCVVLPGFVDCHTHACWAGERWDEWEQKLAGASYLELLSAGGGILSTVRAVRAATEASLAAGLDARTRQMAAYGTTTVEVKSGYGLDFENEVKMLAAIHATAAESPLRLIPTFLAAHAIDPECSAFVDRTIDDTIPAVLRKFPRLTVDAYCENGSWSVRECERCFGRAIEYGSAIRVHTDQFTSLGMIPVALALAARSVDHLEAATDHDLDLVAKSSTIAVGLPATAFCLSTPMLRARRFIDAGGALALATNANPGSAPVRSMPIVISLAVREMGLTPAEALTTVTMNAACVLGIAPECGSIESGKSADLVLWPFDDERALGYELSGALPTRVWARGVELPFDTLRAR